MYVPFSKQSQTKTDEMFSGLILLSWLIMLKRETPMRRRWQWPVFGWQWVSAVHLGCWKLLAWFSKCAHVTSLFSIWPCLHLFRKRTWSQSCSRSLHRGSKPRRAATRGWHASPTDRTWTGPRWPSWSTKATRSHPFTPPENRMNSRSSTSCLKVTGKSRQNRYPAKFHQSRDDNRSLMLCPEPWCHCCLLQRRWCRFWIYFDMSSRKWAFQFRIAHR